MSKMDLNCLELISSDLTVDDVSPLCSFLLSKEVIVAKSTVLHMLPSPDMHYSITFAPLNSTMQASSSIETIILKSRNTQDRFDSVGNDSMMGNRNGFYKELDLVKTPNFSSKLMNAVVVFISKSINLHSVIVDSVQMPTDFISGLGEALSTSRSSESCRVFPLICDSKILVTQLLSSFLSVFSVPLHTRYCVSLHMFDCS
jgi:hypothetical protein